MVQNIESGGGREYLWFTAALLLILVGSLMHASIPTPSGNSPLQSSNLSEH